MALLIINTDGGSRGNPGPAGIGIVVSDELGHVLYDQGRYMGIATNNEAEYQAVVEATEWLLQPATQEMLQTRQVDRVLWKLDSKLVVEQLSKRWKIKEPRMAALASQIWKMLDQLPQSWQFQHVPRAENAAADAKVNQALDAHVE